MSEDDDEILLAYLRDNLHNEVIELKIWLDHLKFKSSENRAEIIMSFGQKLSFLNFFHFLVNS